ncbi:hypothetical protein D9619_002657 [Psilocybe cf. subviscida]|uniref:UBC core domain-containing protein n=1 Tax=Psilocybe cf. subviscida TaxID=2480587 RepID=A0A8H5AX90_9AGAR|nr:hypothetical protein D9619_002657 [Psilocybe cf. subviscida]
MPSSTRRTKRKSSPSKAKGPPSKRPRKDEAQSSKTAVIVIDDSEPEDDEELKEILAQIKESEKHEECFQQGPSSGNKDHPIDLEDDAALAQRLADEWTSEDAVLTKGHKNGDVGYSSEVEFVSHKTAPSGSTQKRPQNQSTSSITPQRSTNAATKPDEALAEHRDLFTGEKPCSKCSKAMKPPRGCVIFTTPEQPPSSMVYLLHISCQSCRTNHCRGCLQPITCPRNCKGPTKNPDCSVLTCCAEIRAIAMFETLGGFDREFMADKAQSNTRAVAKAHSKKKAASDSVGPGGTGYGTGRSAGSYGGPSAAKPREYKASKAASTWDKIVLKTLTTLVGLLPEPYADEPQVYDMLPHALIGHLISLSQLPALLGSLLRNDSVTDWIARSDTYYATLSLLRRMADCELTIQCLIGQQTEMESTCGLENWMWNDGEIVWKRDSSGNLEIVPPLYMHFKKLTRQCEAFLDGASRMLEAGGDQDGEVDETVIQGTSICGDIIAAKDDLERAITILGQSAPSDERENRASEANGQTNNTRQGGKGKGKARDLSLNVDKVYEEACERLCFKHVSFADDATGPDGGLIYSNFMYGASLTQTQTATRLPKSRLHLLKELAVTATSLPSGVWVRVDEVRNDALKIMIAGPEGTPYAGGLFEFDCFLPLEYPATPPLMHLRTTGGGSVRFNPNLYNTGKVCLSLLGTWPGRPEEQWSAKSTLLQVLVSIQSMILIDAPYYNEPGHGQANLKARVSIDYNRNISLQTTRWAIVDWLDDKNRDGIWRDVIYSHFTVLQDKIRKQIVQWAASEPQFKAYQASPHAVYHHPGNPALFGAPMLAPQFAPPSSVSQTPSMDLLAEFDRRMKRIESWEPTLNVDE